MNIMVHGPCLDGDLSSLPVERVLQMAPTGSKSSCEPGLIPGLMLCSPVDITSH